MMDGELMLSTRFHLLVGCISQIRWSNSLPHIDSKSQTLTAKMELMWLGHLLVNSANRAHLNWARCLGKRLECFLLQRNYNHWLCIQGNPSDTSMLLWRKPTVLPCLPMINGFLMPSCAFTKGLTPSLQNCFSSSYLIF